ncbi:MAG: gamma-glutamyl-gamma-aminobutyrate hydrolase family protein [Desulfovibrionaceae bacterium]
MRLGVTMDVHWAVEGESPRDCLDRNWAGLLGRVLPEALWIPLPNAGPERAARMLEALELDGLLFTDGLHLGSDPLRDETELALLDAALRHGVPAFGVGRGLLLFQTRFHGGLEPAKGHRDMEHLLYLSTLPFVHHEYRQITVNSSHRASIRKLGRGLQPFAVDRGGSVEGAYHEEHRLAGVLWNPERPGAPSEGFDARLLRSFFRMG